MITDNWKPGHSTTKGYPYEKSISREQLVSRPILTIDNENRVRMSVEPGAFPRMKETMSDEEMLDFLYDRLFDFQEALKIAENQITHILEDSPFIPDDFGFKKTVGPKSIKDNPTKIYTSKYNDKISLFRNDEDPLEWVILEKQENDIFRQTKLRIPNHRIAYAVFYSLNIQVHGDNEVKSFNIEVREMEKFTASYSPDGDDSKKVTVPVFMADDDHDARTRAKFYVETELMTDHTVEFEHLKVEKLVK
jgi:hypothetical protein